MKQIINIQLGGRSIAIEDSAYQKVQQYLDSLRQHFKNEPGCDEIISDIEGRFSELMHEKLRKGVANITETDVDEMITNMGRPEDFEESGTGTDAAGPSIPFEGRSRRRLYRDENNKMIGGVCSGIANWINIDPTIVRVLFAIIALGGFGTGIFIYILMWIFLPSRNLEGYKGKRLFRNPDNKWFGGVASGIAAYFGKEANTIRFLFSLPILLSIFNGIFSHDNFDVFPGILFGSLTGTVITIYIIFWIVLPEAISPYEKMEMHGRPVDLNSIKNNVQNSMGDVKEKLQNWSKEVQDSATRFGNTAGTYSRSYGRNVGREFGTAAGRGAKGIGHALAVIIKVFFLIIFGTIIFSLFIMLMVFLFSGYAFAPINNFLWTSDNQQFLAWATLLLFIGAPIVGAVVWLFRKILNVTTPGNYLNWLFGGLWTIGWICLTIFGGSISKDFKRNQTVENATNITQPIGDKMILTVSQPELEYQGDFSWLRSHNDRINGFSITKDTMKLSDIALFFEKSPDSLYHVAVGKQSFGQTETDALARSNKLQYGVSFKDSVLDLPSGFSIDKNSKYRLQRIIVTIQVPVGKKIQLDPSINQKLNTLDIDIDNSDNHGFRRLRERRNYRYYESNTEYIMNEEGDLITALDMLQNSSASPGENGSTYRWKGEANKIDSVAATSPDSATGTYRYDAVTDSGRKDKSALLKQLEQKKKEMQELEKKLNQ